MPRKLMLEDAQELAISKGGKCLSTLYINVKAKMLWQCGYGHQWETSLEVIKRGSWCPDCAGVKKQTLEDAQELAISRGGKCLSKEYVNNKTHMLWQCGKGHQWETSFNQINSQGCWCPECSGFKKHTLEEAKELAISRGGECLSQEYVNANTNLLWKCKDSHQWKASLNNIINDCTWCPDCAKNKKLTLEEARKLAKLKGGECLSQEYVNVNTNLLWSCKDSHQWRATLNSIKSGGSWCPECAGVKKQTLEDAQKLAKFRGGELLSQEYVNANVPLLWKCREGHQWFARFSGKKDTSVKKGSWCPTCAVFNRIGRPSTKITIDEVIRFAMSKDGECLTNTYTNCKIKMQWRCTHGHTWWQCFKVIKKGCWCPECAGVKKHTLEDAQGLANSKGGKCLSKEYVNNKTHMLWECKHGHQWKAMLNHSKRGSWCPTCAVGSKRRKSY